VPEHQLRTTESFLRLRDLAPSVACLPVLQGQEFDDYRRHVDLHTAVGVDLRAPVVGLGTVCRRQHTLVAVRLIQNLGRLGVRLHGFGLKLSSVLAAHEYLASADSMAWSIDGRYTEGGRCRRDRDLQVR
jgi:hypothetical protein